MIVINDDAADALVVPEPWADPAAWLYERTGFFRVSSTNDGAQYDRIYFDGRASRHLRQANRSVVAILDNLAGSGTSLNYMLSAKVLVKI